MSGAWGGGRAMSKQRNKQFAHGDSELSESSRLMDAESLCSPSDYRKPTGKEEKHGTQIQKEL